MYQLLRYSNEEAHMCVSERNSPLTHMGVPIGRRFCLHRPPLREGAVLSLKGGEVPLLPFHSTSPSSRCKRHVWATKEKPSQSVVVFVPRMTSHEINGFVCDFFSPLVPNTNILLYCILLCFLMDAGVSPFVWKSYNPTMETALSTLWPAGPVQLGDGAGTNLQRAEARERVAFTPGPKLTPQCLWTFLSYLTLS